MVKVAVKEEVHGMTMSRSESKINATLNEDTVPDTLNNNHGSQQVQREVSEDETSPVETTVLRDNSGHRTKEDNAAKYAEEHVCDDNGNGTVTGQLKENSNGNREKTADDVRAPREQQMSNPNQ
tara:strand:+ start:823 stop:1194 length:372 start_codon:yes stop_codon:yes gene_type:complete